MTTPRDPTHEYDERSALAADYVLGALTHEEAVAFEQRLAADPALGEEVRRLRATFDVLPLATAADPPPHLRARVLAAAARSGAAVPATDARRTTAYAPRRLVWSRFAAAAAAALALAFGIDAHRVRRELDLERELRTTLQEPNVVRAFTLAGAGGAYGTVALDLDAKRGAVVLKGLAPSSGGDHYRLWARVGDADVYCGEFAADAMGDVTAQFVVPVESYTAPIARLFVTKESTPRGAAPLGPTVMGSA